MYKKKTSIALGEKSKLWIRQFPCHLQRRKHDIIDRKSPLCIVDPIKSSLEKKK